MENRFINISVIAIEKSCQETAKVSTTNLRILRLYVVGLSCGLVAVMSDADSDFRNVL